MKRKILVFLTISVIMFFSIGCEFEFMGLCCKRVRVVKPGDTMDEYTIVYECGEEYCDWPDSKKEGLEDEIRKALAFIQRIERMMTEMKELMYGGKGGGSGPTIPWLNPYIEIDMPSYFSIIDQDKQAAFVTIKSENRQLSSPIDLLYSESRKSHRYKNNTIHKYSIFLIDSKSIEKELHTFLEANKGSQLSYNFIYEIRVKGNESFKSELKKISNEGKNEISHNFELDLGFFPNLKQKLGKTQYTTKINP